MATLCETYWHPLYAYARRKGHSAEDAEDLVQGFFARMLEKKDLRQVGREKGRFRSFLLAALNHYIANERDRARAKKRGGGRAPLAFETKRGEELYRLDPADHLTPQKVFERRWALTLLERSLTHLRDEFVRSGKTKLFERLKPFLIGDESGVSYPEVAADLEMSEGTVRVAVHRLRRRFRRAVREEIAQTVTGEDDVETSCASYSPRSARKFLRTDVTFRRFCFFVSMVD